MFRHRINSIEIEGDRELFRTIERADGEIMAEYKGVKDLREVQVETYAGREPKPRLKLTVYTFFLFFLLTLFNNYRTYVYQISLFG